MSWPEIPSVPTGNEKSVERKRDGGELRYIAV